VSDNALTRRRDAATDLPTPPDGEPPVQAGLPLDEEMPSATLTRRRIILFIIFVASAVAFLYFVLPKIAGLKDSWNRIQRGDPFWLFIAVLFEGGSFMGYVLLFRGVFVRGVQSRINWRESYQITMAGVAATRLFAAAGAGGLALTAWALRRSGMEARTVACRMTAFMCLLYVVYMSALVIDGLLLHFGVLAGGTSFVLTILPAIFGATVIAIVLLASRVPPSFERRARSGGERHGRAAQLAGRLSTAPASVAQGVRTAIGLVRARDPQLLGAIMWWGFDIATLWASFRAFGSAPPGGVIVMAYFVGMLGNLLPLPGGIGGVDGGMIGTFAAFDVNAGLAIVAVLVYRAFAFWLPTVPGAIAYLQLRRTVHRWDEEPVPA
jgi:uncharacterized protein (TIRG00374 family)